MFSTVKDWVYGKFVAGLWVFCYAYLYGNSARD